MAPASTLKNHKTHQLFEPIGDCRRCDEKRLVAAMVEAGLKKGWGIGLHDGERISVMSSTHPEIVKEILSKMHSTDDEVLVLMRTEGNRSIREGIRLVWGNDPYEAVNDYSTGAEVIVNAVEPLRQQIEDVYVAKRH